jgi:hypothetical protein
LPGSLSEVPLKSFERDRNGTDLPTGDANDRLIRTDLEIYPFGPEIHSDRLSRADDPDLAHDENSFKVRGRLTDKIGIGSCSAAVLLGRWDRRAYWHVCNGQFGTAGKQG